MAQKKSGTSRSKSTAGKRKAPASTQTRRKSSSASSSSGKKRVQQPQRKPFRREVGAVVCFLLAVFSAFGYFHVKAIFIDFFCAVLKGLFGYGFWLVPPALLLASYILAFHRGRPVRLRLTCALMLPGMLSCVIHGLVGGTLPWNGALVSTLWKNGQAMHGGGVISGVIAQGFVQIFSSVGATVIFVLLFLLLCLGAFNRTIVDVADWIFSRPRYEYEPEELPHRERKVKEPVSRAQAVAPASQRAAIDIPVDDGPLVGQQPKEEEPEPKRKGSFFNRKSRVPAPDQLLTAAAAAAPAEEPAPAPVQPVQPMREEPVKEEPAGQEPVAAPAPKPQEEPTPVIQPAPAPVEEEPVFAPPPVQPKVMPPFGAAPTPAPAPAAFQERAPQPAPSEPAAPKASREETAQAAQEMAQHIQTGMEQVVPPYDYPPLSLLTEGKGELGGEALVELNANKQRLSDTIHSFGIDANIVDVTRGPSVTRYELELDQGVRLNKLTNLADDIALSLGATGVRIAPIPNKISMVGIEVPNKLVSPVNIRTVLSSDEFQHSTSKVSFAVGKDIGGNCIVGNIAKLPHLLIAGTTGSGKSVCTNSLIISLLYKASPEEVRLIMVDPKMVELGIYNGIPHLLIPVVTDPKKAAGALQWAVTEMMKRYRTFAEMGVRDLASYNAKAAKTDGMDTMPQVVVVIDELADLMLVAAKEVEESICRVAQMGRASGMHLIIATQRPSADVITGLMKANIPSRIAFAVASAMESRIILDTQGAEKLVGRGDMLYFPLGSGKPTRVQGCLISDQEVAAVVDYVKQNSGSAQYDDQVMQEIEQHAAEKEKGAKGVGGSSPVDHGEEEYDELINAAIEVVLETGQASVSMLQRRLKLGYARAARLVDQMEEKGIVGPFEGSKARQLLITKEQWQEMQYRQGIVSQPPEEQPAPVEENPMSAPAPQEDMPPFEVDEPLDRAEEETL